MKRTPRTIIGIVLGALILLGGVFAFSHTVGAATPLSIENIGGSIGLTSTDFKAVVINIIRWALGILTLVAVSFIIYGGFLWLTSNGNEKQIEKAKRVILNAVVGLIIVLIAWAIVFFVARTALNSTDGTSGGGDPACCLPPGGADTGFEIRSITTDCGAPPDYRSDVFRCSAVQVTFNHQVNAATVQAAVNNGTLVIKQCATDSCADAGLSIPAGSSVDAGLTGPDRQAFTPNTPSGTTAEWVAKSDNTGKTVTFFHINRLFETGNPSFHVSIPTTIQDTDGKSLTNCQISTGVPVPGCTPDGAPVTRFTWTMKVGNNVDTNPPQRVSSYPTSAYKAPGTPAGAPDENVPRSPIISIAYNQAILGTIDQSHNADPADRLNNTFAIIPFTPNTTTPNPEDQTAQGDPVDPNDYLVALSPDSTTLQIQFKPGRQLEKFQWYRIQVQGVRDLCSNVQSPEPFSWVFETNDVVPAIADHFPRNGTGIDAGTTAACSDSPMFIRYTTSMYDIANSTCRVPLGYVTQGQIAPAVSRNFDVDPSQSCNGCADPQNRCMVYTFTPPPPVPPAAGLLNPGTTYSVGVDNRYVVNDSGGTLRFGSGTWGDAALGAWKFRVGPAGSCINPPVITSIDPSQGTDGQCITVAGFNFDPNSNGRTGGDQLTYDGADVPGGNILGWANTQIASEVPAGAPGPRNFTVKADFPAPFGNLESPAFPWTKLSGSASTGPCLANVTPATGYNLDNVTLNGKRFDPTSTLKRVSWNTTNQNNPVGWTDEQIATSVPPDPPLIAPNASVAVRVQNDNGLSNRVYFDLQDLVIPPGTPEPPVVVDRWPNCGTSCVGADVGARLAYPSGATLTLDVTTLSTGTAIIKRCTTDACMAYTGADITPGIAYDGSPSNIIHFPPSASLLPNTAYRVVLKDNITDTPTGTRLGQLNFDNDGVGGNDSYSWIFKTQTGTGGCRIGRVDVTPNPDLFTANGEQHQFNATAYTESNSCSATGQPMNPTTLAWGWSSDPAFVTATSVGWTSAIRAGAQTVPGPPTIVSASAREGVITKTGNASVTIDFSLCSSTTDCTQGGACGGSVCDNVTRRCTPVINSINPVQGAIGTWVGINGCYFGGYTRGTCNGGTNAGAACDANTDCNSNDCRGGSAVIFSGDKRNLWPNPAMCGAPAVQWHDDNVTVEVPDRGSAALSATSGPLVLQRWDGVRSAASAQSYIVDPAVIVPGICQVSPAGGSEGTSVTITGQQFGATKAPADQVTFYQEKDVATGDITSWADNQIVCRAPNGIANNTAASYEYPAGRPWGEKEIAVQAGGQWSNVADFNVVPPGCQVCTADAVCGAGNSCGYNGCCTSSPSVTAVSPTNGQANVCRNSNMTATFSRAMDANTLNGSTVHVFKGGVEVPSTVNYDGNTRKVTVTAGLLDRNTTYTVSF
ncbi:MAG: Ig-like domain-containing protein, partial [Candidatus Kerfeldbacteria bacterium]|nr:Ig-like domain-containing protein [Candidatus Kerfeldbacteria bacterium]